MDSLETNSEAPQKVADSSSFVEFDALGVGEPNRDMFAPVKEKGTSDFQEFDLDPRGSEEFIIPPIDNERFNLTIKSDTLPVLLFENEDGGREREQERAPEVRTDDRIKTDRPRETGDRLTDTINSIANIPERHEQMVVVTTPSKGSTTGYLRVYNRNGEQGWVDSGDRIPINVGRNGLNWSVADGDLLQNSDIRDTRKREGDGTGPIGLFTIEGAFGLKSKNGIADQLNGYGANPGDILPYRQIVPGSQWVSTRGNYNRWIDGGSHSVKEDLHKIARAGLYEYGLVLGYNGADMFDGQSSTGYPIKQAEYKGGSAIFAHVERGPGRPTAGCTSMSRENMIRLIATLERSKNPLWLQIPESELGKLENRSFQF